jgi:hypothetical protein
MRNMILMAILFVSIGINAQSTRTIAILDLENKANVKPVTINRVADRITKEFSAKKEFIVYEHWMIDTMLAAQSNMKILECKDEQCLFAIGHLLSVDVVINGAVSRQNKQYMISLQLVDIKNNKIAGVSEIAVKDFYDATLSTSIPELLKKIVALMEVQNQKSPNEKTIASQEKPRQPRSNEQTKDSSQSKTNRSVVSKPAFWIPVSAVLVGGAVAGYYFLKSGKTGNSGLEEISLGDAPGHNRISP